MDTKADQEPELLPCPFCGGRARFSETPRAYDFQQAIECESCGANTGPTGVGREEVVLFWNRRVAAPVAKSARTPAVPNTKNLDDAVLAMLSCASSTTKSVIGRASRRKKGLITSRLFGCTKSATSPHARSTPSTRSGL